MDDLLEASATFSGYTSDDESDADYDDTNSKNKYQGSFASKIIVNIIGHTITSMIIYNSFHRFDVYDVVRYCMNIADVIAIIGLIGSILSYREYIKIWSVEDILLKTSLPVFIFKMINIGIIANIFVIKFIYLCIMFIIEL